MSKSGFVPGFDCLGNSLRELRSEGNPSGQAIPNTSIERGSETLLSHAPHHVVIGAEREEIVKIAGIGDYKPSAEVLMKGSMK